MQHKFIHNISACNVSFMFWLRLKKLEDNAGIKNSTVCKDDMVEQEEDNQLNEENNHLNENSTT